MEVVLLIASFCAMVAYEAPELIRRKQWDELALFAFLVLTGLAGGLLLVLRIQVPSLLDVVKFVQDELGLVFR